MAYLLLLMVSIHTYDFFLVWKSSNQGHSVWNRITAVQQIPYSDKSNITPAKTNCLTTLTPFTNYNPAMSNLT